MEVEVLFSKVHPKALVPKKATYGSACYDMYAVIDNSNDKMFLMPRTVFKVRTGLKVVIPEGYALEIVPRSGLACEGPVILPNSPGTIDSDYRGEILIPLYSFSSKNIEIKTGDRIAQCRLIELIPIKWSQSAIPMNDVTHRGEGGFGSTGI